MFTWIHTYFNTRIHCMGTVFYPFKQCAVGTIYICF